MKQKTVQLFTSRGEELQRRLDGDPGFRPWAVYPRPRLVRKRWLCLNGQWDYAVKDKGCPEPARWDGKITVPFCIESQLSGVQKPLTEKEELWYHREFNIPASWKGRHVMSNRLDHRILFSL